MNVESLSYWVHQLYRWTRSIHQFHIDYEEEFNCNLFDLIAHAEPGNRRRLSQGFPLAVLAFQKWDDLPDNGIALFIEYGIIEKKDDERCLGKLRPLKSK